MGFVDYWRMIVGWWSNPTSTSEAIEWVGIGTATGYVARASATHRASAATATGYVSMATAEGSGQ